MVRFSLVMVHDDDDDDEDDDGEYEDVYEANWQSGCDEQGLQSC